MHKRGMRVIDRRETDEEQIVAWRRDQLAGAGFWLPLAARLAGNGRYDLHALIELTERGCAPEVAVRILAPLEEGGDAA
jgi:hypothetical protein